MKRIVALFLGLLLAIVGLASVGFGLVGAFGDGEQEARFLAGAAAIPFGIMLLELGLAAVWLASRAMRGGAVRPATLPPWWVSALIFAAALGGGWVALRFDWWWAFFPLATVAVFAPIAAAGRLGLPSSGVRPGWGRLLAAFGWGALVTPVLAITVQLVAVIGAIAAAAIGISLSGQQNLQRLVDTWTYRLQGRSLDQEQMAALLQFVVRQPLVLAVGAAVLVFAAPVSEELGKFGAAPLFGRTRSRPGGAAVDPPLTIFLIGLAAGLGFAATENVFYVAQAGEQGWVTMALLRSVTPIMHGTASAVFALGWARQHQQPRGWALLWGALGSLGLHAAWNLCAGLVIVAGLFATGQNAATAVAGLLLVMSLGVLGGLLLLSVAILLRQRRVLAVAATPATPVLATTDFADPTAAHPDGWYGGATPALPIAVPQAERGEPLRSGAGRDL